MIRSLLLSLLLLVPVAAQEMRPIKGGVYTPLYRVGDQKQVAVADFELSAYPVTNSDFLAFVRANPEWRRSRVKRIFAEPQYLKHWNDDSNFDERLSDSPVVNVSWFAARAYARWRGCRLPTQDEWELAARADETSLDATRKEAFRGRILDWYSRTTPSALPSVGRWRNVYGLYDMHGLIWEWVSDFNTVLVTGESREDGGISRNLYCAAGALNSTDPSDYAAYMRYAFRSSLKANYTVNNLGFRLARSKGER
ncbi:MAG: formylglycine-generating enzyme family protein [Vulcanimicrobiota bacterium]